MPWPAAFDGEQRHLFRCPLYPKKPKFAMPVQWYFRPVAAVDDACCHPPALITPFLTLFVAGAILALSYQRTGALYFSIAAFHAGWIFWLKSFISSSTQPASIAILLVAPTTLIDGWLSFLVLAIIFVLITGKSRPTRPLENFRREGASRLFGTVRGHLQRPDWTCIISGQFFPAILRETLDMRVFCGNFPV